MNNNISISKTYFFDFLSFPNNPEELFTLLYIIESNENYEIYKAINNETREIYAIKIIPLNDNISYDKLKEESLIMNSLKNCDNIIKYFGSYFSIKSKNIWLVYEYCPSGSVYDLLKTIERPLIEQEISIIINDILNALIYMHQINIINGNIKITNILLSETAVSKLGNFSKAKQTLNFFLSSSRPKSEQEKNDSKYDIFLLGLICIELFKGINNFDRNKFIDSFKKKNNRDSSIKIIEKYFYAGKEQLCSKEFIDFVKKCLEKNSYVRPSSFELKNHPFIKNNSNPTNSEKIYFKNLIRFNVEKIEYNKKANNSLSNLNLSSKSKELTSSKRQLTHLYSSINSISNNTKNSIVINNEKKSMNISDFQNNKNNENNANTLIADKLAEFRMEQMKKSEEVEFDKYTGKDVLVDKSNLENSEIHYGTDNSVNKSMKASAVFGKGIQIQNNLNENKTYKIETNSSFIKKIIENSKSGKMTNKKEEKIIIKDNSISDNGINDNIRAKKESEEIDYFKDNWEHLKKYKDIIKSKNSDINNNLSYNNQFFNSDDSSFDLSNLNNNININSDQNLFKNYSIFYKKYSKSINDNNNNAKKKSIYNNMLFADTKCNIIQLGNSVKKYGTNPKSNCTSEYSLKNSIFRINENNDYSSKNSLTKTNENNLDFINNKYSVNNSQRLYLSFKNNVLNDIDINFKKSLTKDKMYKNDISSTCFTSFNAPINKFKDALDIIPEMHYSCTPFFTVRQKNFKELDYDLINRKKSVNNNGKFNLKKCCSEFNYSKLKNEKKPLLYKYIKELENLNCEKIKTKKTKSNIIKVDKLFIKKK